MGGEKEEYVKASRQVPAVFPPCYRQLPAVFSPISR